jgi:dipeptidase E
VIYLGGGGSADDERAVWTPMLAGRHTILLWPFAQPAGAHPGVLRWLRESLAGHGRFEVHLWSTLDGRDPAVLPAYDLLFVSGGNTYALLDEIRQHAWLAPLRSFVRSGGGYYGGSAGAVLAGADIDIAGAVADPNDVGLTETGGLDLLGGHDVWPHYTTADRPRVREWVAATGRPVLAVPERSGLVVADDTIRAAGPEDVQVVAAGGESTLRPGKEIDVGRRAGPGGSG